MLEAVDDAVEELVVVVVFVPGLCFKLLMKLLKNWLMLLFLYWAMFEAVDEAVDELVVVVVFVSGLCLKLLMTL